MTSTVLKPASEVLLDSCTKIIQTLVFHMHEGTNLVAVWLRKHSIMDVPQMNVVTLALILSQPLDIFRLQ